MLSAVQPRSASPLLDVAKAVSECIQLFDVVEIEACLLLDPASQAALEIEALQRRVGDGGLPHPGGAADDDDEAGHG